MFDEPVRHLQGHQIFLAAVTVAELRYGAIIAEWGPPGAGGSRRRSPKPRLCRSPID